MAECKRYSRMNKSRWIGCSQCSLIFTGPPYYPFISNPAWNVDKTECSMRFISCIWPRRSICRRRNNFDNCLELVIELVWLPFRSSAIRPRSPRPIGNHQAARCMARRAWPALHGSRCMARAAWPALHPPSAALHGSTSKFNQGRVIYRHSQFLISSPMRLFSLEATVGSMQRETA